MAFYRVLLVGMLAMLAGTAAVYAQDDPPPEINGALSVLNEQVGSDVQRTDLSGFDWVQQNFSDGSLGCPQPGVLYTQAITPGYQFLLEYEGVTYDIRVPEGFPEGAFLCSQDPPAANAETGAPAEATEVVVEAQAQAAEAAEDCGDNLTVLLAPGDTARIAGIVPSNLRAAPDITTEVLTQIPPETTITIVDGPTCGTNFTWFQVTYEGETGWVAQGQDGLYFVEPVAAPLPLGRTAISSSNAGELTSVSELLGNITPVIAVSPDGTTLAMVSANRVQPGLRLYTLDALENGVPQNFSLNSTPTSVAFSPDGTLIATGDSAGTVSIYSVEDGSELVNFVAESGVPVSSIGFTPDGTILITASGNRVIRFWSVPVELAG